MLSPFPLITYVIGLALGFLHGLLCGLNPQEFPDSCSSLSGLPKDNSLWKHFLLSLVLFEMPRLCPRENVTDNHSLRLFGVWTSQSKLKGTIACYPQSGRTGTLMKHPNFWNITVIWGVNLWQRLSHFSLHKKLRIFVTADARASGLEALGLEQSFIFNKHSK